MEVPSLFVPYLCNLVLIGSIFMTVENTGKKQPNEGEIFILVHDFRGFCPCLAGFIALGLQ